MRWRVIQLDIVEKIIKEIEDERRLLIDEKKGLKRPLSRYRKIYLAFRLREKFEDTEEEEYNTGLSSDELLLILYHPWLTYEMLMRYNTKDYTRNKDLDSAIYDCRYYLYRDIQRFNRKNKTMFITTLRTRKLGKLYFNIKNEKDFEIVDARRARWVLGMQKTRQKYQDYFEQKEREEEEVRRGRREKTSAQEWEEEMEKQREEARIERMKKDKDWKGNPMYFDVDFKGVNPKDSLKEKKNSREFRH